MIVMRVMMISMTRLIVMTTMMMEHLDEMWLDLIWREEWW